MDSINAAHFSQGKVAAGLTSTTMEPVTSNKAAIIDEDDVKLVFLNKRNLIVFSFITDIHV